jgi:hypothetical protein
LTISNAKNDDAGLIEPLPNAVRGFAATGFCPSGSPPRVHVQTPDVPGRSLFDRGNRRMSNRR